MTYHAMTAGRRLLRRLRVWRRMFWHKRIHTEDWNDLLRSSYRIQRRMVLAERIAWQMHAGDPRGYDAIRETLDEWLPLLPNQEKDQPHAR